MKIKHILYLISLLMLTGWSMSSCSKEPQDTTPEPEPTGTGYLSFSIGIDNLLTTRNGSEDIGTTPESNLQYMRIILYNNAGTAVLVENYTVSNYEQYNGQDAYYFSFVDADYGSDDEIRIGEENYVPIAAGENVTIRRNPMELPVQDYQIAVLLNPANLYGSTPTYLFNTTQKAGHSKDLLYTPIDIYKQWSDNSNEYEVGMTPYELFLTYFFPSFVFANSAYDYGWGLYYNLYNYMAIFMSNADGLLQVPASALENTSQAVPHNAGTIKVDRSLAKVILESDMLGNAENGFVYEGHTVKDVTWVPDILNYRTYPIRIPDKIAPGNGNEVETPSTSRAFRYAKDPNWSGFSNLRSTSSPEKLDEQFVQLTSDYIYFMYESTPFDIFEKTWRTSPADDDNLWYYIPENTMAADEQWEDVTTRVLIRCNYIPPASNTVGGETTIQPKESYYAFNGYIFTLAQLVEFINDPKTIPAEMDDIRDVLKDESTRDQLTEPLESIHINGISFYKNGVNFYSVPIRHFDDGQSQDPMDYGRYGVVRNNVYKVTIQGFTGPGFPLIPKPEGPNDKETNVNATINVLDWNYQNLDFQF